MADSNKKYTSVLSDGTDEFTIKDAEAVKAVKVGSSGSAITPTNGTVTIPAYEEGADVTDAENVKAALGTNSTHENKFLRKDGTWQTTPDTHHDGSVAADSGYALTKVQVSSDGIWSKEQIPIPSTANLQAKITASGILKGDGNGGVTAAENMASLGFAYGICETATGTAAKTVTINSFILLNGCIVSVLMANRMNESNPTMNVSGTGALPLWYHGASMPTTIVKPNTTLILQYDGTHWNVIGLEHSKASFNAYVDLDLPSGLLWATKNIDVTQQGGFAISEFQYECSFFSWGNTDGHNPTSTSSFGDYSFGTGNDTEPYVSSPGAAIEYPASAGLAYDAARVNCGAPWRLPTTGEFVELFANIDYIDANGDVISSETADKRVTVNGVLGLYCRSKNNGEVIFFPCSGYGHGTSWHGRGSNGYYWSSSLSSQTNGRFLVFLSGGVYPQGSSSRFNGFAVRPVQ